MNRLPLHSALAHNSKIEVDMYCPFFLPAYGGAELATLHLAKELKNRCSVALHTFNRAQGFDVNRNYGLSLSGPHPEQELIDGVPVYRYPVTNLPMLKDFSFKLISSLKSSDANIVHFQGAGRLLSRLLLQKIASKKMKILTTHGLQESAELVRRSKFGTFISPFFIGSFRDMDHIIALSKADVRLLIYSGINKNKITLIPNGIDIKRFEKRRKFVERNGKMKILCVARFDKNKNYESLVCALSKLKRELEFEAYIVGAVTDVKYFEKIMSLIKKNGLEKIVKIGVSLDDSALVDCYLSCDLFVLPSTVETFALVILEAMYAGLPVIATPVGYVPELIRNKVNGFIIPKNDPIELYKKCLDLSKDEKMRKEMGRLNKEISKNYTWSKIASSTYDLYEELMGKSMRK